MYIYALVSDQDVIRYVGCSGNPQERARLHWSNRLRKTSPVAVWLKSLQAPPRLRVLQQVTDDESWYAESDWIRQLDDLSKTDLLNVARYRSKQVISQETREKMSRVRTGRHLSPDTKEKVRQAAIGRGHSAESREKMKQSALHRTVQGNAKLTEADVISIRSSNMFNRELSKIYGVKPSAISRARSGQTWRKL